jgi:hypothetical protein
MMKKRTVLPDCFFIARNGRAATTSFGTLLSAFVSTALCINHPMIHDTNNKNFFFLLEPTKMPFSKKKLNK